MVTGREVRWATAPSSSVVLGGATLLLLLLCAVPPASGVGSYDPCAVGLYKLNGP
jgi:hypothetical protein